MGRILRIFAPAKVNLFLGVHEEKDARGYHRVDSLMACVDVADVLEMREAECLEVACVPPVGIPQEANSCWVAARKLAERFGREPDVRIVVEKHVPDRAGLGGSSADAAATIVGLCRLWGEDPADERCVAAAREVGADVPFFLVGSPCFLEGAGDVARESFPPIGHASLVLAKPTADGPGITAAEAYRDFDREPVEAGDASEVRRALRERRWDDLPALVENNFEPVAERISPRVAELRAWLSARPGVRRAMVTGSGSCVFAFCEDDACAATIAEDVRGKGMWAHAGTFVGHGPQALEDAEAAFATHRA